MSGNKQIFGDNFESNGGNMYIAKDHAIQTNYSITPQSPVEDLLKLLDAVQQELPNVPLPDLVKAKVQNEVEGAKIQVQEQPLDKQKIAVKLKNATAALEEGAKTISGAVTIGNLLSQAILWCGNMLA